MSAPAPGTESVGPVLENDETGRAVAAAIRATNRDVKIVDRGAYWRVLVPHCCRVTRQAIERCVGGNFRLPGDLERIMPSFKGRFTVNDEEATWTTGRN